MTQHRRGHLDTSACDHAQITCSLRFNMAAVEEDLGGWAVVGRRKAGKGKGKGEEEEEEGGEREAGRRRRDLVEQTGRQMGATRSTRSLGSRTTTGSTSTTGSTTTAGSTTGKESGVSTPLQDDARPGELGRPPQQEVAPQQGSSTLVGSTERRRRRRPARAGDADDRSRPTEVVDGIAYVPHPNCADPRARPSSLWPLTRP